MRRILPFAAICTALLLAVLLALALCALPPRLAFSGGESYTFYVGDTSKNCRVVTASPSSAPVVRLTLGGICGESATYSSLDPLKFIEERGGRIIFSEELSDSFNYYCRAPLPYSVTLYGEEINLHICVKECGVTVASPIIFGGY